MPYKTIAKLKMNTPANAKSIKQIANNTLQYELLNGNQCWQLHDTCIIEKTATQIILNSDGFKTQTTKSRINKYLPSGWYLYQEKGIWYIKTTEKVIQFYDGITLNLDGTVPNSTTRGQTIPSNERKKS